MSAESTSKEALEPKLTMTPDELFALHPLPWTHHLLLIKDANGRQVIHTGGLYDDRGRLHEGSCLSGLNALLVELVNSRVSAPIAPVDHEAKAKEIVEEYKQRVMQLPSGDAVPCAKWLETRLRIALDLAAPASTVAPQQPKARYEKAHEARYSMTHPVHPDIVVLWFLALKSHWFDDSNNVFYGQREAAKAYLYKWVETGELADDHTTLEIATANKFREWLSSSWTAAPASPAALRDEAQTGSSVFLQIPTCGRCPFVDHSGSFTPGGAKTICNHRDAVKTFATNVAGEDRYHWKYRQVNHDAAPPEQCPLRRKRNER